MRKYILPFITMLIINFLGLYLGGLATNPGVKSYWYQHQILQAPWTPPGYVFAITWTLIGITWSVLGAWLWKNKKELIDIYAMGWFFNLSWNFLFFTMVIQITLQDLRSCNRIYFCFHSFSRMTTLTQLLSSQNCCESLIHLDYWQLGRCF